jgi:transcriptional regulator with XRE-family HTH domain
LSKIENDRMRPSAAAITQLAQVLGANLDELLSLAGRLPNDLEQTLTGSSGARAFFRSARELNLNESDWKKMLEELERKKRK